MNGLYIILLIIIVVVIIIALLYFKNNAYQTRIIKNNNSNCGFLDNGCNPIEYKSTKPLDIYKHCRTLDNYYDSVASYPCARSKPAKIIIDDLFTNQTTENFAFTQFKHTEEYQIDKLLLKLKSNLLTILLNCDDDIVKQYIKVKDGETLAIRDFTLKAATKSFTTGKKEISLCIKCPDTGVIYPDDVLMYVLLHEMAHVMSDETGHTTDFDNCFDCLLKVAKKMGIDCRTHQNMVVPYCGVY